MAADEGKAEAKTQDPFRLAKKPGRDGDGLSGIDIAGYTSFYKALMDAGDCIATRKSSQLDPCKDKFVGHIAAYGNKYRDPKGEETKLMENVVKQYSDMADTRPELALFLVLWRAEEEANEKKRVVRDWLGGLTSHIADPLDLVRRSLAKINHEIDNFDPLRKTALSQAAALMRVFTYFTPILQGAPARVRSVYRTPFNKLREKLCATKNDAATYFIANIKGLCGRSVATATTSDAGARSLKRLKQAAESRKGIKKSRGGHFSLESAVELGKDLHGSLSASKPPSIQQAITSFEDSMASLHALHKEEISIARRAWMEREIAQSALKDQYTTRFPSFATFGSPIAPAFGATQPITTGSDVSSAYETMPYDETLILRLWRQGAPIIGSMRPALTRLDKTGLAFPLWGKDDDLAFSELLVIGLPRFDSTFRQDHPVFRSSPDVEGSFGRIKAILPQLTDAWKDTTDSLAKLPTFTSKEGKSDPRVIKVQRLQNSLSSTLDNLRAVLSCETEEDKEEDKEGEEEEKKTKSDALSFAVKPSPIAAYLLFEFLDAELAVGPGLERALNAFEKLHPHSDLAEHFNQIKITLRTIVLELFQHRQRYLNEYWPTLPNEPGVAAWLFAEPIAEPAAADTAPAAVTGATSSSLSSLLTDP